MLRIPLTVAEVRDRAAMGRRVAVCRQCFRRPPGSEALGSDVPRSCQAGCEVFEHLPRLARAAACVDPMLGPYERPLGQLIERICTGADGPGRGCPLYRYSGEVVEVLARVAGGTRRGKEFRYGDATDP